MKKAFGNQIKAAREARGLTQTALGKAVGVSSGAIAAMEQGRQGLRWRVLEALAEQLGQSPAYFFDVKRRPEPQQMKASAKLRLFELVASLDENQAQALLPDAEAIKAGLRKPLPAKPKPLETDEGESGAG